VDPLAGKYAGWSPYTYTLDNPVRLVDPTGAIPSDGVKDCCPGVSGTPSGYFLKGMQTYFQAAGKMIDDLGLQISAYFGYSNAVPENINRSVFIENKYSATISTSFEQFLSDDGYNKPKGPPYVLELKHEENLVSKTSSVTPLGEGVTLKTSIINKVNTTTAATTKSIDVVLGKGASGAFINVKNSNAKLRIKGGLKGQISTPKVKGFNIFAGGKVSASKTIYKE